MIVILPPRVTATILLAHLGITLMLEHTLVMRAHQAWLILMVIPVLPVSLALRGRTLTGRSLPVKSATPEQLIWILIPPRRVHYVMSAHTAVKVALSARLVTLGSLTMT